MCCGGMEYGKEKRRSTARRRAKIQKMRVCALPAVLAAVIGPASRRAGPSELQPEATRMGERDLTAVGGVPRGKSVREAVSAAFSTTI